MVEHIAIRDLEEWSHPVEKAIGKVGRAFPGTLSDWRAGRVLSELERTAAAMHQDMFSEHTGDENVDGGSGKGVS